MATAPQPFAGDVVEGRAHVAGVGASLEPVQHEHVRHLGRRVEPVEIQEVSVVRVHPLAAERRRARTANQVARSVCRCGPAAPHAGRNGSVGVKGETGTCAARARRSARRDGGGAPDISDAPGPDCAEAGDVGRRHRAGVHGLHRLERPGHRGDLAGERVQALAEPLGRGLLLARLGGGADREHLGVEALERVEQPGALGLEARGGGEERGPLAPLLLERLEGLTEPLRG